VHVWTGNTPAMNYPAAELRGINGKKTRNLYPDAEHRGILLIKLFRNTYSYVNYSFWEASPGALITGRIDYIATFQV